MRAFLVGFTAYLCFAACFALGRVAGFAMMANAAPDNTDPRVVRIVEKAIEHEKWEREQLRERPGYIRYTPADPDVVSLIQEREAECR